MWHSDSYCPKYQRRLGLFIARYIDITHVKKKHRYGYGHRISVWLKYGFQRFLTGSVSLHLWVDAVFVILLHHSTLNDVWLFWLHCFTGVTKWLPRLRRLAVLTYTLAIPTGFCTPAFESTAAAEPLPAVGVATCLCHRLLCARMSNPGGYKVLKLLVERAHTANTCSKRL